MDSLVDRWKTALHSADHIKYSLGESAKRDQDSKKKGKEALVMADNNQSAKVSLAKEDKLKQARTRSNDAKKTSAVRDSKKMETPNKKARKQEKLIQNCTNAILQVSEPAQPDKIRLKIKSLLEDLLLNAIVQKNQTQKTSMIKESVSSAKFNQRAYLDLQTRYFECQKERQYLRGKMEMMTKRYENVQREIERYSKIEKLVDNSIAREAQMRQQLARVHSEKQQLETTISQQQCIFSREVQSIRQLIQTLKMHLPVN